MPHIVILGAGVIGLQSAIYLLDAGHSVTVVATNFPGETDAHYTSPWAGAHWRTHASSQDHHEQNWDIATYNEWSRLLSHPRTINERDNFPLKSYASMNYWDAGSEPGDTIWWAPLVTGFRMLPPDSENIKLLQTAAQGTPSTKSQKVASAAAFESFAIDAPAYLTMLREQIENAGGVFVRFTANSSKGLSAAVEEVGKVVKRVTTREVDVLLNATGLGARELCGDDKVYPVKGQTVLVRGEADAIRTRIGDGYLAYCIPRPGSGTTILGGTKDVGSWDSKIEESTTKRILERCRALAPELLTDGQGGDKGFNVLRAQVGLRPAREGGARMEIEEVKGKKGTTWKVVHAYGHSGAGFQNSVGVARDVIKMVHTALSQDKARL